MKTWLRLVLVTLSVGGGFTGFSLTLPLLLHPGVFKLSNTLITACFLLMYAFVVASGLVFAANSEKVRLLFVALALQVPYVIWPFLKYKFAAGILGFVFVGPPETVGNVGLYFGTELRLGAGWSFGYNVQDEPRIGINLAAAALMILLWRAVHAARETRREMSADSVPSEAKPVIAS